jgi:hypothetical protein
MRKRLFSTLALIALLGAACSSTSDGAADDGVATLEVDAAGDAVAAQTSEELPELSPDEAALEFSSCMRDNGVSFPDLAVGADGNIQMRESMQAADPGPRTEEFRTAMDVCRPFLESAGFGGGRAALTDNVEVADALVAFSECVRDAGYDVGELALGGPGQGGGQGQPPAEGQAGQPEPNAEGGPRQAGFGDINERFASQLGLDPDDAEVIATMETCSPIVTEALAAAGLGR